ncbi:MAG: DNA polymerase III subunit alpha [Firmicutes bacterium]|nr:DNA polymerase III subunit alpha [Bacillota bacterium]
MINSKGLAAYFLIVWDFINFAKKKGIPVGPGRGSAAGSLVAYLLGITEIDPIRNGLIFERFLNPERKSLPDIDTDFCWRRRDEVIKYVAEKYGSDRVTQIVTFGRMKARAAIRDVGRALNLPLPLVDKVAKLIPFGKNIQDSLSVPELKELYDKDQKIKQLLELAKSIEGLARNASIHAAGVVISEAPLPEHVPLQRMNGDEIVAQYEMNSLASIGLLKMDFLGLRNLTVMSDCINIIKETLGQEIDILNLPMDDEKTYQLLRDAQTLGVFQLESPGMRRYIKLLRPSKFEDIVALNALYRPGPLGGGVVEDFIKRKNGKGKVKYLHPSLEPILKETYGIILYQEQVMQIANLAGYSMAKADELRKAMGKKKPEEMAKHREIFESGAVKSGISKKIAEKIFELMEFFAGYGFNKSHSAAYAMVAYQTAYLKANFPKEYMAALMTSIMDSIEKVSFFVQECKDMSINVYPPDINESLVDFKVEKDGIRFGMGAIKNAGRAAIESIIETREMSGKFKDIFDLSSRVDLRLCNKRVMESLIKSGAMDCIGPNRATLLANLDSALEYGAQIQREKNSGQISFFDGALDEGLKPAPDIPYQEEFSKKQLLSMEKEMIGLYLSAHPLEEVAEELKKCVSLTIEQLSELAQGSEIKIGGLVKTIKKIFTRNNQPMAFLQFEDFTGTVEVIVPPKVYEETSSLINEEAILVISGKVDIKERFEKDSDEEEPQAEEAKVLAVSIAPLNGSAGHTAAGSFTNGAFSRKNNSCFHIKVEVNKCDILPNLKDIITNCKGDKPVYLHLESCKGRTTMALEKTMWVTDTPEFFKSVESLLGEGAIWTKTEGTA